MQIRPIFASLRKHRIPALLIVLEIALACAVLCNAVFMISGRLVQLQLPNAIDEKGLALISLRGNDPSLARNDIPRNIDALRRIPGVKAVGAMNSVPLTGASWNESYTTRPDNLSNSERKVNVAQYFVGAGADNALGLQLRQGHFFEGGDYAGGNVGKWTTPEGHVAIITQSLADRLWPDQSAVGKKMWGSSSWYTVVGVVADVLRPSEDDGGLRSFSYAAFFPVPPSDALSYYVVRSAPEDNERVAREANKALADLSVNAVTKARTFSAIREAYFADTRSMVWMLLLVCVVMLSVTAFGIVGLTSFWVAQRRRQIGVRRALGATRGDILSYFRTENFLLTALGLVIGMVLAYSINMYLMWSYEMQRMPLYYLAGGAVAMWVLGQIAAFGPAHRAASVPPVEATRG